MRWIPAEGRTTDYIAANAFQAYGMLVNSFNYPEEGSYVFTETFRHVDLTITIPPPLVGCTWLDLSDVACEYRTETPDASRGFPLAGLVNPHDSQGNPMAKFESGLEGWFTGMQFSAIEEPSEPYARWLCQFHEGYL